MAIEITKFEYYQNVKPFFDAVYEFSKRKKEERSDEENLDYTLVSDLLLKLIQNETNMDGLKKTLDEVSPLEKRILEKYGLNVLSLAGFLASIEKK